MLFSVTNPSARDYWLYQAPTKNCFEYLSKRQIAQLNDIDVKFAKEQVLDFARINNLSLPVHVNVNDHASRHNGSNLKCHILSRNVPSNSFVELPGPVYVISPEMCFLLSASELSLYELAKLGYDLCAIYMLDPDEEYGQKTRTPLTSVGRIKKFLSSVSGFPGITKARKVVAFILNNSNSPMESKLAFIACLPFHLGGYNLIHPEMNPVINLSREGADFLGRPTCRGDLFWKRERVDLEYDSNLSHLTKKQHAEDKRRTSALSLSGYNVISVTHDHLTNRSNIDNLFFTVRHALGMRPRKDLFDKYKDIRWEMLKQVFLSELEKQYTPENPYDYF